MRGERLIRVLALTAAIGLSASLGAAAWQDAEGQQDATEGQDEQPRRRTARLIRPWTELEDLTPRQEATIREIRTDILNRKDELDREERQRIMEVLTESQRQRVAEIEAARAREQEERRQRNGGDPTTRSSGDNGGE